MTKEYSQDEINQILLSKKLDDFWLAIIEKRKQESLSNEEDSESIKSNGALKDCANFFIRYVDSLPNVRRLAILTIIGDEVYDVGSAIFENLQRNKIIHYDNLTEYYNESNARVRYFTPDEEPRLKQETVLLDTDLLDTDEKSIIYEYANSYTTQESSEDLTDKFLSEARGKAYTLNR